MSTLELQYYEEFPDDQYVKAIAKVKIDGKHKQIFVLKPTKTGGTFWVPSSVGVTKNGEKKYFESYRHDSDDENERIKDFVKQAVAAKSAGIVQSATPKIQDFVTEYGTSQKVQVMQSSNKGAPEDALPF